MFVVFHFHFHFTLKSKLFIAFSIVCSWFGFDVIVMELRKCDLRARCFRSFYIQNWDNKMQFSSLLFLCFSYSNMKKTTPSSFTTHVNRLNDSNVGSNQCCVIHILYSLFRIQCIWLSYFITYFPFKKNWRKYCAWLRACQSISCCFHFFLTLMCFCLSSNYFGFKFMQNTHFWVDSIHSK